MYNKDELLSIGEMSKLTGVGIQALRYYERINILKPVYTDPDSGYRYYVSEQAANISIISTCVELNIPLKELVELFETEDVTLMQEFFERNRQVAEQKLIAINTMRNLADKALGRLESNKSYEFGQIYEKEFSEKTYYLKPCGHSLVNKNREKLLMDFEKEIKADLMGHFDTGAFAENVYESMVLMEYGFLCKCSGAEAQYFTFGEVPSSLKGEQTLTTSPGVFKFVKSKNSRVEAAPDIFRKYLGGSDSYMVIEVEEMMSGMAKINEPIYELRLVPLQVL